VVRADRVITISAVVPDPLAGFTGGARPILPGVADTESCRANEELGLLPMAGPGRVEGNPVRGEMEEAARLLGERVLAVDAVPAPGGGVAAFAAGLPWLVGRVTTPMAREAFCASCRPAPSVLAAASVRSLEALLVAGAVASPAVQTSGTMLLAGECREGAIDASRVRQIHDRILAPRLGGAALLVHSSVPPAQVLAAGLRPVRSLASALEVMRERAGGDGRISVIADAQVTLPVAGS
jgi:hypothetical protein